MASVPTSEFQTFAAEQSHFDLLFRRQPPTRTTAVRRRPTAIQGRSLEILGHAIEYLVDSELDREQVYTGAHPTQAAQVLMRLSREVFADCEEVVPLWDRILQRMERVWERKPEGVQVASVSGTQT